MEHLFICVEAETEMIANVTELFQVTRTERE